MASQLKCLIVDDDRHTSRLLADQITDTCPGLCLLANTTDPFMGKELIEHFSPDVVFLDIHMPGMTGFELLDSLRKRDFWVVFITSYTQYAIRALKMQALDYLLKPIDIGDLRQIQKKLLGLTQQTQQLDQLRIGQRAALERLPGSLNARGEQAYLTVAHAKGLKVIRFSELLYLKANGPYCEFCMEGEKFVASKGMKYFEELLPDTQFFKIHKSYIINMDYLKEYLFDDVPYALMTNGHQLEIARRRKEKFLQALRLMSGQQ